jgi:L-threonylcarbamoyladenylate synthase
MADAAAAREILAEAAAILERGGLVAFPTETVYGLGANALDPDAVARIYEAKGRPAYNPLIVHVHAAAGVSRVARAWPDAAERLANSFWPGPLTLVLPKRPEVPDSVTAGLNTVGVRVPSHPVAHALLTTARLPIAAPSANRSMALSPTRGAHVAKSLGDAVDLILDAGPTQVGIESTVVDVTGEVPLILRPGIISRDQIEAITGPVRTAAELRAASGASGAGLPSPGMMDRHYAPRATLMIGPDDEQSLMKRAAELRAGGARVAVLIRRDSGAARDEPDVVAMPQTPAAYAAVLFDTLHRLDDAGCDLILVQPVPTSAAWAGIRDRLSRATR